MSLAVGIDVGAYKCAATVCRQGEREAKRSGRCSTSPPSAAASQHWTRGW
jgi:hypothetical protein